MITVYSPKHRQHNPATEFLEGEIVAYVEAPARAEALVAAVQAAAIGPVIEPQSFGLAPILAVHSEDYVTHLQTIYADWCAAGGAPAAVIPFAFPRVEFNHPSASPFARAAQYAFDLSAPITAHSWEAIVASADCALTGAALLTGGERFAYALCRPPGHHASQDLMGGYCFLNNAAIAAEFLTAGRSRRVAIVDIDVHGGNGTQRIFYERDDVLFISIHGDPDWEYPFFMGFAEERGTGAGTGYTCNYPLPQGTGDSDYLLVLDDALGLVRAFQPHSLVISAGFDTFDGDPLGKFKLTTPCYAQMGARFAALNLPTLVVQEGGYAVDDLGENVVSLLQGLEGIR